MFQNVQKWLNGCQRVSKVAKVVKSIDVYGGVSTVLTSFKTNTRNVTVLPGFDKNGSATRGNGTGKTGKITLKLVVKLVVLTGK